jgi:hypothetical protein
MGAVQYHVSHFYQAPVRFRRVDRDRRIHPEGRGVWNSVSDYRIGLDALHTSGLSTPGPESSPMTPIHDVDALLLLATALSSKRRPAALNEFVEAVKLAPDNARYAYVHAIANRRWPCCAARTSDTRTISTRSVRCSR